MVYYYTIILKNNNKEKLAYTFVTETIFQQVSQCCSCHSIIGDDSCTSSLGEHDCHALSLNVILVANFGNDSSLFEMPATSVFSYVKLPLNSFNANPCDDRGEMSRQLPGTSNRFFGR